jgi:hypothetical protein
MVIEDAYNGNRRCPIIITYYYLLQTYKLFTISKNFYNFIFF